MTKSVSIRFSIKVSTINLKPSRYLKVKSSSILIIVSDEIHRLLIQKANKGLQTINEKRNSCINEIHLLKNKLSEIESLANEQQKDPDTNPKLESYLETEISNVKSKQEELEKIVNQITSQSIYIEKLVEKISKLKKGSIALLNQVTTISKLRILDPINQRSFSMKSSLHPRPNNINF